MEDLGLVGDLAIVVIAAVIGGAGARLLRLPAVIGYLAAGVLIGPHTPGPTGDVDDVQSVANLGVALLMFTLGIQFSLRELSQFKELAALGGLGVTAGMVILGSLFGTIYGLSVEEAVVAGMAISLSSSMLALRLLEDRDLIGELPGRITISLSLVQDMTVVLMLTLIPVLSGDGDNFAEDLALAVGKAIALLAGVYFAGTVVLPPVLGRIAASRSRELFLLTVVALALGTASISAEAGLSLAFGAFLAGLVLSESDYAHRTLSEVLPLREVFAVVFFVAIGMLMDPQAFVDDPVLVVGMAALALVVKSGIIAAASLVFRYPVSAGLTAALALGTMGEFSFVVATQALDEGVIDEQTDDAILAAVLLSMAIAPLILAAQDRFLPYRETIEG